MPATCPNWTTLCEALAEQFIPCNVTKGDGDLTNTESRVIEAIHVKDGSAGQEAFPCWLARRDREAMKATCDCHVDPATNIRISSPRCRIHFPRGYSDGCGK